MKKYIAYEKEKDKTFKKEKRNMEGIFTRRLWTYNESKDHERPPERVIYIQ